MSNANINGKSGESMVTGGNSGCASQFETALSGKSSLKCSRSDRQVVRANAVFTEVTGQCYDRSVDLQLVLSEGQYEIFILLRLHLFFHSHLNEKQPIPHTYCSNTLAAN